MAVTGAPTGIVPGVHVTTTTQAPVQTDADTIAVGLFDGEQPAAGDLGDALTTLLADGEARSRYRHLAQTRTGTQRVIAVGLGARTDLTPERARIAAALAGRRARDLAARSLCWLVPDGAGEAFAEGLVQGTVLGAYRFDRFRASREDDDERRPSLEQLTISCTRPLEQVVARAAAIAAAQNRARDLGNRPPNDLTPAALAEYALALADRHPALSAEIVDGAGIRARGMGAFAAVAQGSEQDPRLITLRYDGGEPGGRLLALVGKAVTFDSGGLWIKPPASMIDMKFDMCGGAAVIETIAALAEMQAPVNVIGVIGATENMISGAAMRPGDVLTASDGTTIEMNNSDAEGRLVLADCIVHARSEGADAIVDIATLTGGVVIALGSAFAGLMASDDALAERITACGLGCGERVWRLPLDADYAGMVKGRVAQIMNRTERREASAITAAEFLHHFAGDVPWAHLDIAGVADHGHAPYLDRGATGWGVRLLTELALSF